MNEIPDGARAWLDDPPRSTIIDLLFNGAEGLLALCIGLTAIMVCVAVAGSIALAFYVPAISFVVWIAVLAGCWAWIR